MTQTTVPSLSKRRLSRLNRRQRKKLRVGEFQELGFWVELKFKSALDDAALDATIAPSGTDALIQVTGKASETYRWTRVSSELKVIP